MVNLNTDVGFIWSRCTSLTQSEPIQSLLNYSRKLRVFHIGVSQLRVLGLDSEFVEPLFVIHVHQVLRKITNTVSLPSFHYFIFKKTIASLLINKRLSEGKQFIDSQCHCLVNLWDLLSNLKLLLVCFIEVHLQYSLVVELSQITHCRFALLFVSQQIANRW